MYKIKNELVTKPVTSGRKNPLLESKVNEAFLPGKSGLVVSKLEKILARRLRARLAICPLPTSVVNSKGKFLQYFGLYKKGITRWFSIDFHISQSEEIYSISFYENEKKFGQPTRVVYLNGFNIVKVLDQIADCFTGDIDLYDESSLRSGSRLREARLTIKDMMVAWLKENPSYSDDIVKDSFDYEAHKAEFMSFIQTKFNSHKTDITAGSMKWNACKAIEENPDLGSFSNIPVVAVDDNPPKNRATDDSLSPEDLALWDEVMNTTAVDKWDQYREYVTLIAEKDPMSWNLIAYGMPGTGKTHDCEQILNQHGVEYTVLGSAITDLKAIMIQLYEHKDDEIIVFDDLDAILSSSNRSNMFKQIFQQKKTRITGMNATIKYVDENGDKQIMPPKFEFTSRCIMLSNKPRDFFEDAILNRVYSIELNFTKEEMMELIQSKMSKLGGATYREIGPDAREEIFNLLNRFKNKINGISLRTYEKGLQAYYLCQRLSEPNWQKRALQFMAGV